MKTLEKTQARDKCSLLSHLATFKRVILVINIRMFVMFYCLVCSWLTLFELEAATGAFYHHDMNSNGSHYLAETGYAIR